MTLLELLNRLRDRLRRDALARELDEELRFHRALLKRDATLGPSDHNDATDHAARRLGNATYYREETRAMWSLGTLDEFLNDLRFVLRTIRATPAFSIVVTLTLALGIGTTTAMYSIVNSILLRPLPYRAPESLVQLRDVQKDGRETPASYPEYLDWRQRSSDVLSDVAVSYGSGEVLETPDGAEQLQGSHISANMLDMIGLRPLLGRGFRIDDEARSAPRVVMLSEPLWRNRLGADPAIVGRTITLTGFPYVVIGIFAQTPNTLVPSAYQWSHRRLPDFFAPLRLDEKNAPRGLHWLDVVGRLRPGVDLARARTRLAAMAVSIQHDRGATHGVRANALADALVGNYRAPLGLMLIAVAMLLAIACANVASLLLARAATRRREFAMRTALGAGRQRLVRLVLVESVFRAVIGGALGVALAYALVAGMRVWLGASVARMADVSIDARVLVIAVAISVICGLAFGIIPAARAGRSDIVRDLRDGGRGVMGGMSRDRSRRSLIVAEVALSFVLLATAGLLTRSVVKLLAVPKGFDVSNLVAGYTWLPSPRYADSLSQKAFFDRLLAELGGSFGDSHVTLASDLPIAGGTDGGIGVEGRAHAGGMGMKDMGDDVLNVEKRIVGNNYFGVLGARLATGRLFSSSDVLGAPPVVIVNETFARLVFPKESAVGKRVSFNWGIDGYQTIVGVVADLREGPLNRPSLPAIYMSAEQRPNSSMRFLVRSSVPAAAIASTFRAMLRKIDPTIPLVETETMDDVVRADTRQQRLSMVMLGAFACMALLLAAVGLYGVISYSVAQRTQELGIRAALGALPGDLMRLVLRQAMMFAVTGVALGIVGALATGRLIASQLFGVGPSDPLTLSVAAMLLGVVAVIASVVPTRKAAKADPLEALRAE